MGSEKHETFGSVTQAEKTVVSFAQISNAIKALKFPEVECVVGIARGGLVPAAIIAHQLGLPLHTIAVNYRDDSNRPRYAEPLLIGSEPDKAIGSTGQILLVDDVSVTGKTFQAVKALFPGRQIITLALKGKADMVLFPDIRTCVIWPWSV